ncbi:nuclear factor 7, brain-like [Protopterus annectens]|uniref:nuclear factor 7, brain-like n=1 Tax=Protopterus annectens TaxID=7888 RepID=UPI001CFB5E85|nr:nuclear factor 7, brain-like [Protopterus annectens]
MADRNQAVHYLICTICQELFHSPVATLECGHNYCKSCIDRAWQEENVPRCPVCRQEFPSKKYAINTALGNLAKGAREAEAIPRCEDHGEKLRLFCKEDNIPVCVICRDSPTHAGHSFLPVGDVAKTFKGKLEEASVSLKSKLEKLTNLQTMQVQKVQGVQYKSERLQQCIEADFADLRSLLQTIEGQLIEQVKNEERDILREMDENLRHITENIASIKKQMLDIEAHLKQEDPLTFLQARFLCKFLAFIKSSFESRNVTVSQARHASCHLLARHLI